MPDAPHIPQAGSLPPLRISNARRQPQQTLGLTPQGWPALLLSSRGLQRATSGEETATQETQGFAITDLVTATRLSHLASQSLLSVKMELCAFCHNIILVIEFGALLFLVVVMGQTSAIY